VYFTISLLMISCIFSILNLAKNLYFNTVFKKEFQKTFRKNLTEVHNESKWHELQTLIRSINSIATRSRKLSNKDRKKTSLDDRKTSDRLINQRRSSFN
jgi:hypothetical protein